jgi:uncharacterized protein (DUF885 family)
MAAVPDAYRQLSATLLDAARKGRPPARLQVEEVARQCAAWAGPGHAFYCGLAERLTGVPDSLRGELDAAAREATAATAGLGAFLRRELLPLARDKDACGPEIYARASRYFLGAAVDLAEAYAWCRRWVCRDSPAKMGVMATQTSAYRDPSRGLQSCSRVVEGLRGSDHHRLHRRSGFLGSR